jgi:two-component system sensor histidine kinase and response regulator WspE
MIDIDPSMFELFREEVRLHSETLSQGLLDCEADPGNPTRIEPLMRAAHSIKGASRIIGIELGVRLSHAMEDTLVAAQEGKIRLTSNNVDLLLQGSDILSGLAGLTPETIASWETSNLEAVQRLEPAFLAMAAGNPTGFSLKSSAPAGIAQAKLEVASDPTQSSTGPSVTPPSPIDGGFPPTPAYSPFAIPIDSIPLIDDHSMLDLFREELRSHLLSISSALDGDIETVLASLKQIRGAARIVKCGPIERVASALSQFMIAVREKRTEFTPLAMQWMRLAISTLAEAIATDDESLTAWINATSDKLNKIAEIFESVKLSDKPVRNPAIYPDKVIETLTTGAESPTFSGGSKPETLPSSASAPTESVVRVTAQSLNRLMGLAGESLVQARWLPSFSTDLLVLKKQHDLLASMLDRAFRAVAEGTSTDRLGTLIADARQQASVCRSDLTDQAMDFEEHAAQAEDLNARLYREVIVSRMRPFGDGIHGLARLVRDMARSLGKEAKLIVEGETTEVDRDILEKLESPLSHLVRNAVDHGLEQPEARSKAGKPKAGTIRVEARHRAGTLQVAISDDGRGVDLDKLRRKIVDRGLNAAEMVQRMSEAELLEFLFLPGFSTATAVTEFSGRGVGLDVVQDTIRKVGGTVRISTEQGRGTTFHLQLPLTLSVIRAVVVDISGEPYAFPHTRIDRLIRVHRKEVRSLEHRQFFTVDGHNVGLVVAAQLLDLPPGPAINDELPVVLLSDATGTYGLVVDSFRGEQDLVVRPLDARLGKVPNLSAAAILDDGSPVLIVDAEDLLRSTDQFIQTGALKRCETRATGPARKKRVLVVDDSITVREVERQLLLHRGYDVGIAVDGMEGWNKIRSEKFDLLVSDIDMPRMSGLQLVTAVRGDEKLRDLPVVIVSYKERDEDRMRGLEVGANRYLTKSSFHDNRFIEAVEDLIGTA